MTSLLESFISFFRGDKHKSLKETKKRTSYNIIKEPIYLPSMDNGATKDIKQKQH